MPPNNTDKQWELWGQEDPYYGVLTSDRYHRENLTAESLEQFFASGQRDLDSLLAEVRLRLAPDFSPKRALDFGCGVGRVLIPLASLCASAVGVDVSEAMLAEAQKNCTARELGNVKLVHGDDELSGVDGTFDFIHSYIVFQHIPPRRGLALVHRLLERLEEGGVGALHFHYHNDLSPVSKAMTWAYHNVPLLNGFRNLLKGRPFSTPRMQMNAYDLNRVLLILQRSGCANVVLRLDRKRPQRGVFLLFRKESGS